MRIRVIPSETHPVLDTAVDGPGPNVLKERPKARAREIVRLRIPEGSSFGKGAVVVASKNTMEFDLFVISFTSGPRVGETSNRHQTDGGAARTQRSTKEVPGSLRGEAPPGTEKLQAFNQERIPTDLRVSDKSNL